MEGTLIIDGLTATVKKTIEDINTTDPKLVEIPAPILKKWLIELRSLRKEKKNQSKHKKAYK